MVAVHTVPVSASRYQDSVDNKEKTDHSMLVAAI
jgi:hypothetical protein